MPKEIDLELSQGANLITRIHNKTYNFIASDTQSNHTGRALFITGGNVDIGKAIAISFARADASYTGIGTIAECGDLSHELVQAAQQAGRLAVPKILCLTCDVTDSVSVKAAADKVHQEFPRLDVLVNNAGFMTPASPVIDPDEFEWWKTFEVNLKGVFLISKHFAPILNDSPSGLQTMVNINSVAAHDLRVNASAYGTSKVAVLKFVEFLLVEQASQGLLAYSVHPGGIMTELARAMPESTHGALTDDPTVTGDSIAFLTQKRREWLAGTYLSCTWDKEESLSREDQIQANDSLKVRLVLPDAHNGGFS